jgi:coenzyme F420-0 gamma-glutamyl ligase (EC 6.3.2.-)
VILSDTFGRPWRDGQTDVAIGAAGLRVVDDLRGSTDTQGRVLEVTVPAIADELAGAADLVKGKAAGRPVAVVRGLGRFVTDLNAAGAKRLIRAAEFDMFRWAVTRPTGRVTSGAAPRGTRRGMLRGSPREQPKPNRTAPPADLVGAKTCGQRPHYV